MTIPETTWIDGPFSGQTEPLPSFQGTLGSGACPHVPEGALLDCPGAGSWLKLIAKACAEGLYTFQAPLDQRSGPRVTVRGRPMLQLSSYDYLGLIGEAEIDTAAREALSRFGAGTGGVRLLTGSNDLHLRLEREIAEFKGVKKAVVFTSGYMATLGAITALFGPRDRVIMDSLAHRSIVDACRLARVQHHRFEHNDYDALEWVLRKDHSKGRTLVVVEGVYSMDGDLVDLPRVVELKKAYGAFLMVDEAHSLGVLGTTGRGIDEHWGVPPEEVDLWMASLSKAVPSNGGFLAGAHDLMTYLQHGAGPFMFSAALTPPSTGAALAALRIIRRERGTRQARLQKNTVYLRDGLRSLGYDTGDSESPIIPVIIGDLGEAFLLAKALYARGVLVSAIIPPAVPVGQCRLRLCATASHTRLDLEEALLAFGSLREGRGPEWG